MLDITNNQSIPWIQERLLAVVKKYNINSFYLDLGSTYNMPHFYRCINNLQSFMRYFVAWINNNNNNIINNSYEISDLKRTW